MAPIVVYRPTYSKRCQEMQTSARSSSGCSMLRVTTLHASSAAATACYYAQYLTQAPGEEPGCGPADRPSRWACRVR